MKPMILFTDADDTLLTTDKEISDANAEAIRRALGAGHRIVLSTGRALAATKPLLKQLNLNRSGCYAISFNGAQIWDCGQEKSIFRKNVETDDAVLLFNMAEEMGLHCQAYDETHVLSRRDNEALRTYCRIQKLPFRVDPSYPASLAEPSVKLLFIDYDHHDRLVSFRERAQERFGDRLSFFFSNDWYLECVCKGISKGEAVRSLSALLGIGLEDTIAAGDSENDLSMLRVAGISCAVANAAPAVKAEADYITERDCNHSAVAEIIEKFML